MTGKPRTAKPKPVGMAVLLAALLLLSLCFTVTASSESLSSHFTVWCNHPGAVNPLPVALLYAHENGIVADGILHFMPLTTFLEHEYSDSLPAVTVGNGPLYSVKYDRDFYDSFSESVSYYEFVEDSFLRVKKENGELAALEDLQPGDYLMAIEIHAEKGEEYFSGVSFIHIFIPGGGESVWPLHSGGFPSPTPSPTPTVPPATPVPPR